MTQLNPLERAKQGDPTAIATLMNRSLNAKGIHATAQRQGDQLQIDLESAHPLNRPALTAFVESGLKNLGLTGIRSITLVGKTSDHQVLWDETLVLNGDELREEANPLPPPRPVPPPPPAPSIAALSRPADDRQFQTLAPGEIPVSEDDLPLPSRSLPDTVPISGINPVEPAAELDETTAMPEAIEAPDYYSRFPAWEAAEATPSMPTTSSDFYLDDTDAVVETPERGQWTMAPESDMAIEADPTDASPEETGLIPVADPTIYPSEQPEQTESDLLLDTPDQPSRRPRSNWLSVAGVVAVLTIGLMAAIIGYSLWRAIDPNAPLPDLIPPSPTTPASPDAPSPSPT